MTLLAVKIFAANTAKTASLTGTSWQRLNAVHQRGPEHEAFGDVPEVVIANLRGREDRMSPPRGLGQKGVAWRVEVLLAAKHSKNRTEEGQDNFDTFCEAVADAFRRLDISSIPTLVDPISQKQSYVTHIGEAMEPETLDPVLWKPGGPILMRARIWVEVREILTA